MLKTAKLTINRLSPEYTLALLCLAQCIFVFLGNFIVNTIPIDAVEMTVIGRDLVLGYPKHPMLPGWLTHVALSIIGYKFGLTVLVSLQIVITYIYVFRLGVLLFQGNKEKALGSVLIVALVTTNFYSLVNMVNNITVALPLCAMLFFYCYKIILGNSRKHWIIFSIVVGLLINTHYILSISVFAALLAIVYFIRINYISLLIFIIITLLLLSPHLYYVFYNDFMTIKYGYGRASKENYSLILSSLQIVLFPFLILVFYYKKNKLTPQLLFVCFIYLVPLIIAFVLNFIFHFASRWLFPFYIPLGFFVLIFVHSIAHKRFVLLFLFFVISTVTVVTLPLHNRMSFPSSQIYQVFLKNHNDIQYIYGPTFESGALSLKFPSHPRVVFDGKFEMSPWVNKDNFYNSKVLYLWDNTEPQTIEPIESGKVEYSKISRYNKKKKAKILYWKVVDYTNNISHKHS